MINRTTIKRVYFIALFAVFVFTFVYASSAKDSTGNRELKIIREGLESTSRETLILSLKAVSAVDDKDSLQKVKLLLNNKDDYIKIEAAMILDSFSDKSGYSILRKILSSKTNLSDNPSPLERARAVAKGSIKSQAALALGDVKDMDSVNLLKSMLDDDDGRVTDACMISLGKMGYKSAKDEFLSAVESANQGVRAKAARALGEIGDITSIDPLKKRLQDWNREVKVEAMLALAKLGDTSSTKTFIKFTDDKDAIIREKAVIALGILRDKSTIKELKRKLKDDNGLVRIAAVESLYMLGDDSGKGFILKTLESSEKDAVIRALQVLDNAGDKKDISKIEKLLENNDPGISISAARTIVLINKKTVVMEEK